MSVLKYRTELEEEFKGLSISIDLKNEIDTFMRVNYNDILCTNSKYHRLYYRTSLQYIIENINNPNLIIELKQLNSVQS